MFLRQSGSEHFDTQPALAGVFRHPFFRGMVTEGGSARGLDRRFPVNLSADGTEHGAVFSQILPFQSCITKFASDHLKFHSPCYGDMRFPVCLMP